MRAFLTLSASLLFAVSCAKNSTQTGSSIDSLPEEKTSAPRLARCSQVSEIEKLQVRETLIVQVQGDVVSGTYHFATGDKNSLTDTGFQHLLGKIAKSEENSGNKVNLTLKNGTLTTYFDEDFAAVKELSALNFDLKEKKVSFTVAQDERATTIGGCQFE